MKKGDKLQCTPNGTRIPDGPPPCDEGCNMPPCPPPPVPPFPIPPTVDANSDMVEKMDFKVYEASEDKQLPGNLGDRLWKPPNEKPLTPREAKTVWLEREAVVENCFGQGSK